MGSAIPFYKACNSLGIKPILGCELYVVPDDALGQKGKEFRAASFHLTVLALSAEGYHNLVAWTSDSAQPENFYYKPRISLERMVDSAPHSLHHNVILSGCLGSELSSMLVESNGKAVGIGASYVEACRSIFPNFYIEIQNHRIKKFDNEQFPVYQELLEKESAVRDKLIELSERTGTPVVVTNDSHFQTPSQRKAHVAMKAASWRSRDDYFKSKEQLIVEYLPDYAYFGNYMRDMEKVADGLPSSSLQSAADIAGEARIRLDPLDDFSYSIPFSGYDDPVKKIRSRAAKRLRNLSSKHGEMARVRFEYELEAMGDFAHYLLLISDFIIHARKQGILTNTRGSAANSLLCYCLKIHDVDSIEYGLTFSRFFNPARKKLPDIDIDIEQDRYEDFMEFVKEKMVELEGEGQCIPICNYGTLANRSAFRLAASALGIPKEKQDEISKLLPQMIDSGMIEEESDVYEALKEEYPEIYELSSSMFDSLKSVGQHACGWVFGTQDRPLKKWVPSYLIASSGTLVAQFNLKSLEELGLVKGDFLRLRTLSVIKRTLQLLGKDSLDLLQIPLDDEDTFEMLREGRTEGIFTLQGKENRRGCIECEVENVHDVIAAVAIYRPALTRPGLHRKYNARRRGEEVVDYPHPLAEEILSPTYGIPVFQEQAMELGYAVGLDDAGVDEMYQAIKVAKGVGRGAKEAFAEIEPKFLRAARKVMSDEDADATWEAAKSFAGYGFNKGHATSYGLLAVRSAYLKCHHPAEFFTALLDVYPEKAKYIAAARGEGFAFLRPDVNFSGAGFTFDKPTGAIRVGLSRIKGLGPVAIHAIVGGQPYSSLDDFRARTNSRSVNSARITALAEVGAFNSLGITGKVDDAEEFHYLGFTTNKPKAFSGIKPKHVSRRVSDNWFHKGREKSVELTDPRTSVSKLFWIPPVEKILELKASPWAQVKTWLLKVIDENGVAFQVMANEDKPEDVEILKFLDKKGKGSVVCLNGAIRQPFLTDGPQGFRIYGVAGARDNDAQVWNYNDDRVPSALNELDRRKRVARYA